MVWSTSLVYWSPGEVIMCIYLFLTPCLVTVGIFTLWESANITNKTHTHPSELLLNIYLLSHPWGSVNILTDFLALCLLVGF